MQHETNPLGQPVGLLVRDWKPPALPSRDTMEGAFCRLEALDPDRHARELNEANNLDVDGRNWTYLPYGPFATLEDFFVWLSESAAKSDPLFFAIIDKAHGKAVGVGRVALLISRNSTGRATASQSSEKQCSSRGRSPISTASPKTPKQWHA